MDWSDEGMVGARGFEPPTPCAQGRCATRLRYAPTDLIITDPRFGTGRWAKAVDGLAGGYETIQWPISAII